MKSALPFWRAGFWAAGIFLTGPLLLGEDGNLPVMAKPPWPPAYKLSPDDKSRLTEADVAGPDGLVYPNWRMSGVPGGISHVPAVVPTGFFKGLENQDVSVRLREAIREATQRGGGTVELPAGKFFLDQPVIIRDSGIVVRGAGRDKTILAFRDRIQYGEIRLFNWSETGEQTGPGGAMEVQANPKELVALLLESAGRVFKETPAWNLKVWGNRFALRFTGSELLSKLGSGEHEILATATYRNGDKFTKTLRIRVSKEPVPDISPGENGMFAFVGRGLKGKQIALIADGNRGSRRLQVANSHGLRAGDRIVISAPITDRWNNLVGNTAKASGFRQYQYEIVKAGKDWINLNQPLRIEFPVVDGSFVQRAEFVERSGVENLTIEQIPIASGSAPKIMENLKYWYPIEDLWMDGVTSSYAWGCWVRGVRVVTAGRNPIYLTRSKFCEIRDCEANEALFKGAGGTGYVGLERSFDCLLESVVTHNMRHAPNLQWGAAGNVVRNGKFYGSDAQWHAGWTNENLFEGNHFVATAADMAKNNGYGYGLFATGPSDPIHGPEGPRNVVYHNDIVSPKDGLRMMGGNEAWIIAYNRFHIADGFAVYGKEKSFDHIIRDNVFMIQRVAGSAVHFDSPDCVGIELIGNSFFGSVRKISGFRNGVGALAREENNRVLPYDANAPMPTPPAESIFEWQRSETNTNKPPARD